MSTVKFVYISQDTTAQLAMRSGSIQGSLVASQDNIPQWKAVPGAKLFPIPPDLTTYLSMDVTQAPLNDVHVRRAIAYAIDRTGLAQTICRGLGAPAQTVVPAGMLASVASEDTAQRFFDTLPKYDLDLTKSKKEVAKSGYPNGLSMSMMYISDYPLYRIIALNLQSNLASIGVKLQLKPILSSKYYATVFATHKDIGLQIGGLQTSIADPNASFGIILGKANAAPNLLNMANYYPADVEGAWEQMNNSTDKSVRWRATQTLLTKVAEDVPYAPIMTCPQLYVVGGGFHLSGASIYSASLYYTGRWIYELQ